MSTIKQMEKQFRFVNEVPQPLLGRRRLYSSIYEKLKKHPGKPALVSVSKDKERMSSLATTLRYYGLKVYTRTLINGDVAIYAIYQKSRANTRPGTKRTAAKRTTRSKKRR